MKSRLKQKLDHKMYQVKFIKNGLHSSFGINIKTTLDFGTTKKTHYITV